MFNDGPRFWWQHPERSDINCDYAVDVKDFMTLAQEWLAGENSGFPRLRADINNDGIVNIEDFALLVEKWCKKVPK